MLSLRIVSFSELLPYCRVGMLQDHKLLQLQISPITLECDF